MKLRKDYFLSLYTSISIKSLTADHPIEDHARPESMAFRLTALIPFLYLLALLCGEVEGQIKSQPRSKPASAENPKCIFLRYEANRIRQEAREYFNQSPLANVKTPEELNAGGE